MTRACYNRHIIRRWGSEKLFFFQVESYSAHAPISVVDFSPEVLLPTTVEDISGFGVGRISSAVVVYSHIPWLPR